MSDRIGNAAHAGVHPEALKVYVRLVVEALRGISGSEPDLPCDISLSTLRALADALEEQIACVTRRVRGADPSDAGVNGLAVATAEQLALCLERHIAARLPSEATGLSPADLMRHFVEMHFAEHLTIDQVAAAVGCARSRVAAICRHDLGESFHQYVARVRIRRAAELIVQGEKIEAVMLIVGYRSKKNFYHQFKRETGETPAAYRRGVRSARGRSAETAPGATLDPASSMTIASASRLLGVSRRTVYNWILQGKLRAAHRPDGGWRIISLPEPR